MRVIPYTLGFSETPSVRRPAADGSFRILFVGRLVERKGVTHLIDAVRRLPSDLRALLTVIGEGPERAALEEQATSSGLDGCVVFRGRVADEDLQEAFATSDVLVLPSIVDARGDTEGLGVVLLEAMSCGVPVVASRVGGIVDIIEDGESGLLVPPGEPQELARALERLARNSELAARLGAAGERRVRSAFGWPEIMRSWDECYSALRAGQSRAGKGAGVAGAPPPTP